ncbi:MAG: hypothetical protein WA864_15020 [Acetobacteraceae bacterium]|jgi:hypothetical protein
MQQFGSRFGRPSEQAREHWQRCKKLPPLQNGEAESLTTEFLATRSITVCPARYAVPLHQRYERTWNG